MHRRCRRHAAIAASTMWSGVAKSGSPAPKPMTFSPAARMALALFETARVADGAMAPTRREIRSRVMASEYCQRRSRISSRIRRRFRRVHLPRWHDFDVSTPDITIPADLLPADGRFGSGPTKVRPEALAALGRTRHGLHGHLPPPDAGEATWSPRCGTASPSCSELPDDGYEIICGNGGSTGFWDAAVFGLIERASRTTCRSASSAASSQGGRDGPHLDDPIVSRVRDGDPPAAGARRRRRRLRLHPQRDLDRRGDARSPTGSADPAISSCWSTPPRVPAA